MASSNTALQVTGIDFTTIKNNLKQIDKKIARSKSYDEIVSLTKEYYLLEKKLKQYENQTN